MIFGSDELRHPFKGFCREQNGPLNYETQSPLSGLSSQNFSRFHWESGQVLGQHLPADEVGSWGGGMKLIDTEHLLFVKDLSGNMPIVCVSSQDSPEKRSQ